MSAVDTQESSTPAEPQGPVEIIIGPAQTNLSEAPKADVTDVEVKETKAPVTPADSATDEDSQHEDKGRARGVQTRIDELTRSRREAEREAAYWKERAGGNAPTQNPAQVPAGPKAPEPSQFKTQEEFIEAITDYKVEQKLAQKDAEQTQAKQVTDRAQSWQEKLVSARLETPDFDQVMNNADTAVASHVADLLLEADSGANIAYHLAQNPDKLEKLNSMSVAKAAIELGKLEALLAKPAGQEAAEVKTPEAKISKAPPPTRPVGQGRSTTPALADLSMEDYVKQRRSQGASWAR